MANKDAAISFLKQCAAGDTPEAVRRFLAPGFRHHNPYFPAAPEALFKGMEDNARQFPGKVLDVKHALEDGDLVAVHSHVRMKPGDRGIAVVHLLRFEGGKIAEFWDVGQEIPADSPNENGMF
jgi:predicted SnoaL-like aldol condensation-catalyzing enzyme